MGVPQLPRMDYTGKDFQEIVTDVLKQLRTLYGEQYTDFEQDSAGRMLIEAYAYVADLLLFYLDRQANECYLPTAKERQKLTNLCKLIGYDVSPAVPAQATVVCSLQGGAFTEDVTIPAGTPLTTAEGTRFELDHAITIRAGEMSATGTCTHGQTFQEAIGTGNGEAGQTFSISRKGVIAVQKIYVGTEEWKRIESLALSGETRNEYTAEIDAFGVAKISFGNGRFGRTPPEGAQVTAVYRIGGGECGNVAAHTIVRIPTVAKTKSGETVFVTCTNPESASGGSGAEDIEHIRAWAPATFSTQGRLVTEDDYTAAANGFSTENIGRFAKAKAVVHEKSGEANVIRIYALAYGPDGSLSPSTKGLADAFIESIEDSKMLTDFVEVVPAGLRPVKISADVAILPGFIAEDVLEALRTNLKVFLDPTKRDMGEKLRFSDLCRAMDDTPGVDWVELREPRATVQPSGAQELLTLGDVELAVVNDG